MDLDQALSILHDQTTMHRWLLFTMKRRSMTSLTLVDQAFGVVASAPSQEVLPPLAELVWNADHCPKRIQKLFMDCAARLPVSSWPAAEESIRRNLQCQLQPGISVPHRMFRETHPLILIGLCHPSGRVREEAIHLSKGLDPGLEASLLLVRINDWVAPVRDAAALRLTILLEILNPVEKTALVPLFTRLRECGRHRRPDLLDKWQNSLANPFDGKAWLEAWRASRSRDRKGYLEVLRLSGHPPDSEIRRALLASNDRLAILWLIREILPGLEGDERDEVLAAVRKSRVVSVKREWLTRCLESRPAEETESILKDALLDRSRGIRQFARFHLDRISRIDFTEFYRDALSKPESEAMALTALAEVDSGEAHQEAVIRLESEIPAVLKAALSALEPGSLENFHDLLIAKVDTGLPGVSKAARKRLFEIRRILGAELLARPILWKQASGSTLSFFIRMASDFQKWDGLEFLLARFHEGGFRDELMESLRAWHRNEKRSFSKLPSERKEKLLASLDHTDLMAGDMENLRFLISHAE